MKSVIRALLAASMLMPIAAQAQEQDGRERGQGRRGEWGQRADRPERSERPARSAEVGVEAQVRTERPQRARFRADPQQAPVWRQDRADDRDRDNRERSRGRRDDTRPDAGRQDWRNDDQRPQVGNHWSQRDRDDPDRFRRGTRDTRQDDRRPGYARGFAPGRNNWQGNDPRDWNDGRRYENRGGSWNRGWRNDARYDWTRNRQVNRSVYRLPRYYAPSGWGYGYRRFSVGVSLSSILFNRNYWIEDPYAYRLPEAYGPYRWVRYYDDALLVDVRTGQVIDTVYDIFY